MQTAMYIQKRPRSSRASGTPRVTIRPSTPKSSDGRELQEAVREVAAVAEQPPEHELERRRRRRRPRSGRASRAASAARTRRRARATTRNANPSGLAARRQERAGDEAAAPALLQRPEREQRRTRRRARTGTPRTTTMPGRHDRERAAREPRARAPLAKDDGAEREARRSRSRATRQQPDPEQRRERVVEDAVRDERVAARVPEVVPDREAVLDQERRLVRVRSPVDPGRCRPEQRGRQHGGDRRSESPPRARAAGASSPASCPHPTRSVVGQARPDVDVAPPAFLEVRAAERALEAVAARVARSRADGSFAGSMRSSMRCEAELVEAPAGEQPDGAAGDAAAPGAGATT